MKKTPFKLERPEDFFTAVFPSDCSNYSDPFTALVQGCKVRVNKKIADFVEIHRPRYGGDIGPRFTVRAKKEGMVYSLYLEE